MREVACVRLELWQWEEKQQADMGPILETDCKGPANALDERREGGKRNQLPGI